MIADDLELDVPRALEVLLDVDVAVAEGGFGFALGCPQRMWQLARRADDAHATPSAARHGLHDHREPDVLDNFERVFLVSHGSVAAWQHRYAGLPHRLLGACLVAKQL